MAKTRGLGRLGMLAVGLGIGAAVASPGMASADPVSFDFNDIAISFDGYSLLSTGTATADSGAHGEFNFAFADGAGAEADAQNGTGNVAEADGTDAYALAGGGNSDTAIDIGNNSGIFDGAYAGTSLLEGGGNNDVAYILGDNSEAFASGYGLAAGNNDVAAVFDPSGTAGDYADAGAGGGGLGVPGDFDLSAVFGDGLSSNANGANFLVDILPAVAGLDSALSTFLTDIASLF
jgi:hypothetical protein